MRLARFALALLLALPCAAGASEKTVPDDVGSAVCADCHEGEAAAWAGSHHALAWTEPSPDTV